MQLSRIGCCCGLQFVDDSASGLKTRSRSRRSCSVGSTTSTHDLGFLDSFGCEELRNTQSLSFRRWRRISADFSCSAIATAESRDDIGSVVRALQSRDRFPKKWLGQHYMVNEKVNEKVVDAARISPGDLVVEIGPGTGALTKFLVAAGAHVIAVEKDPDMASLVAERFAESGKVDVVNIDFLKWPLRNEITRYLHKLSSGSGDPKLAKITVDYVASIPSLKRTFLETFPAGFDNRTALQAQVVSNLPFNITTNVVKKDEAALRLVDASPDSGDYRPISFVVNFYSVPEYKFKVTRKSFFPVPRVDGGVVRFDLKKESEYPPVASTKGFFSMINSAFNGKRKMLRNTLQHMFTPTSTQAALLSVGLPETARPEELTLDQFVEFYNAVTSMENQMLASVTSRHPTES